MFNFLNQALRVFAEICSKLNLKYKNKKQICVLYVQTSSVIIYILSSLCPLLCPFLSSFANKLIINTMNKILNNFNYTAQSALIIN